MYPTRRLWAVLGLAAFLAVFGVLAAQPLLLVGAGLVGAWVLTCQGRFTRQLAATADTLHVQQTVARSNLRTGADVPVTLRVTCEETSALALEIAGGLPTAAVADAPLSVTLPVDEDRAEQTVTVSWATTGHHAFTEPTVTATDGRFHETLTLGETPTVTVETPGPRTVHVGEGGDRLATAYGEHEADRLGTGLEPAELREYVPGDTADQIDWKATARLGTPYVREYEAETDHRTLLVVDHRASLGTGARGETKLAYLREVALATTAAARRLGDPTGLVTVGDEGITFRLDPATAPATYTRIRQRLLDLDPVAGDGPEAPTPDQTARLTAADAQRTLTALTDDGDAFADTLRPFYASREQYHQRLEDDPLYGAVRTAHREGADAGWTIIFTDDSHPAELRQTVKFARSTGAAVMVLLAPTVLYEPGGLADLEAAYERYVAFEELRRDLARIGGVTALEVGPTDRLSTVLSRGRSSTTGGHA